MAGKSGKGRREQKAPAGWQPDWRRLGRWALGAGLFGIMGAAGVWGVLQLRDPAVLPLKVLRVEGQPRYLHIKRRDIERAVGRVVQGNFFTLDVAAVRRAAMSLPWVARVSVRRVWPDTLQLEVLEQVPLARWGKASLVNAGGEVFTPADVKEIPPGLVSLHGPEGTATEVVAQYQAMLPLFARLGLNMVRLQLNARRDWQVRFANGLHLRLGSEELEARLQRFLRVYPRLAQNQEQRLISIDLRYSNGFAARWEKRQQMDGEETGRPQAARRRTLEMSAGRGQV
jgi:cell division protein FtsQ